MPEGCLNKTCLECEWHIVRGRKIDCNYLNRLGLSETGMGSYMTGETDEDKLKRAVEASEKRLKEKKEELKRLKEAKKEVEE